MDCKKLDFNINVMIYLHLGSAADNSKSPQKNGLYKIKVYPCFHESSFMVENPG